MVGVHAKSVRASMAPLPVIWALAQVVPELPDGRLQVNIHYDVFDAGDLAASDWSHAHGQIPPAG